MITSYGTSQIGLVRKENEDAICVDTSPFFVLADGMGGYRGGKLASSIAVSSAEKIFKACTANDASEETLNKAVMLANRQILDRKKDSNEYAYMGTTMIAAAVRQNHLYWAHVGDSRLYVYHRKKLEQLTTDHSFVMELVSEGKITKEEMRNHPRKNEITRAVGINDSLQVDTGTFDLEEGDLVLICSDGLSNMISDDTIQSILENGKETAPEDLKGMADSLMKAAYEAGALDNISLILINYEE